MSDGQVPRGETDDVRDIELKNDETSSPVGKSERPEDGSDKISYDRYRQLLSEKKTVQDELSKLRSESEKLKQDELKANERYKELWETTKQENESLKQNLDSYSQRWNDALKINAFHEALGDTRKIDPKYSGFIDTDKILIDPSSNKVDSLSVHKEVERVIKSFPEIVKSTVTSHLPNTAPSSGTGSLSHAEWEKLPSAEMIKRRKEVKF